MAVGADLVEDGIPGHAICTHYNLIDFAPSHQAARHAVADECDRYFVLVQLPNAASREPWCKGRVSQV